MSHDTNTSRRAILTGGVATAASLASSIALANSMNPAQAPAEVRPDGRFKGKVVAVTGGNSGIGEATVRAFAMEGAKVVFGARRDALGRQVEADIRSAGGDVTWVQTDVRDPDQVERFIRSATDTYARLDVLFNNAGMFGPAASIDEVPVEAFDEVVAVNLRGMFIAARLAFAQMRAQSPQGGRIINNGSISAYTPRENSVCYTTTKHAITGLTKTLSLDGRAFDIACGQIDIGNAETELVAGIKATYPGLPTMDVEDAARSVLHMAELPPEANVQFMTVMATKMPYIGRG